jgi:hypothetical protein
VGAGDEGEVLEELGKRSLTSRWRLKRVDGNVKPGILRVVLPPFANEPLFQGQEEQHHKLLQHPKPQSQ